MTSWPVYVDCVYCSSYVHISSSVFLLFFFPQRLAAGNGRGPLTGLNAAIIYLEGGRESYTKGGGPHVKHVPDISRESTK